MNLQKLLWNKLSFKDKLRYCLMSKAQVRYWYRERQRKLKK